MLTPWFLAARYLGQGAAKVFSTVSDRVDAMTDATQNEPLHACPNASGKTITFAMLSSVANVDVRKRPLRHGGEDAWLLS